MNPQGPSGKTDFAELFTRVPELGIEVAEEVDGFTARLQPNPPASWTRIGLLSLGWLTLAGGVAWVAGDGPELRRLLFGCILIFGMLLSAFRAGKAFFPVELAVSHDTLYVNGERYPRVVLGSFRLDVHDLVLTNADGAELYRIAGIGPNVAAWLTEALAHWKRTL